MTSVFQGLSLSLSEVANSGNWSGTKMGETKQEKKVEITQQMQKEAWMGKRKLRRLKQIAVVVFESFKPESFSK